MKKSNSFFARDPLAPYGIRELAGLIIGEAAAAKLPDADKLRRTDYGGLIAYGLTEAQAEKIMAAIELGRTLARQPWEAGCPLRSSEDIFNHFRDGLGREMHEFFYVVLLNNKNRKIREVKIAEGSLTASIVHPREVFRPVIQESAAAVIFVHNHPSGDPAPSPEDIEITRRLKQVGDVMGVRVLDHVIIGHDRYFSFSDRGML